MVKGDTGRRGTLAGKNDIHDMKAEDTRDKGPREGHRSVGDMREEEKSIKTHFV